MNILVTGGAGFIGSNFARLIDNPVVYDKLTYAGNPHNLPPNIPLIVGDITDGPLLESTCKQFNIDAIVNFAAESHVDRSILEPDAFIKTQIIGVYTLLEFCRKHKIRLLQVSTDEVYGSVQLPVNEDAPLRPNNPYSAAKAAGEDLIRGYYKTYGLDVVTTRGANTYGPYQYPEKLIPLMVTNAIDNLPLPVYGNGQQTRDWLYVLDHCSAIYHVLKYGKAGEIYNISSNNEKKNIDVCKQILRQLNKPESLLVNIVDRLGHDLQYKLDTTKLTKLGWSPTERKLDSTIDWYVTHESWWRPIKESTGYREYYRRQYGN